MLNDLLKFIIQKKYIVIRNLFTVKRVEIQVGNYSFLFILKKTQPCKHILKHDNLLYIYLNK